LKENMAEIIGDSPEVAQLNSYFYFPVGIYTIMKPEYLAVARDVCKEAVDKVKKDGNKLNDLYPVYMTQNLDQDPRMLELSEFTAKTAWNILESQGHNMQPFTTNLTEFWCQEHYKHSAMDQHVHGFGSQLVGFYFVDCPEDCSKVIFYDPKPGKVQNNLPELDPTMATYASNMINFQPEPGMLMFANSWLAHSFTRHGNKKPMRFIHFNVTVNMAPQQTLTCQTPVEVV
jgi:uncharacterized protein (TIGR02466 family)